VVGPKRAKGPHLRGSRARCGSRFGVLLACSTVALAAALMGARAGRLAAAEGSSSEPGATEPAHWVKKKLDFTYLGFTTHYSCQGLRDKVREVLLELGARRSDLNVHEIGCTRNLGRPEPAPSVGGTFYVLEPAPSSIEHPVEAAWQRVNVRVGTDSLDRAGQCELVDQVRHTILPLFSTRNVNFKQSCVPYQLTPGGTSLSVEVLKPTRRK
jgi:hypothetical protein